MAGKIPITSPITASGQTGPLLADSDVAPLTITVAVGTVSGTTPSCTFTAERCLPGTDAGSPTWDGTGAVSATALTATGTATITLPPRVAGSGVVAGYWRLKWAVTGTTPSFAVTSATAAG